MNSAEKSLQNFLHKRQQDQSIRTLQNKSHLIDFCSNDYLGFSRSALLKQRVQEVLREQQLQYTGATGSRLITGNFAFTEKVEHYIAEYHDAESALLFNSGYDANVGFFSSVPQKEDVIFFDELVHASIRDGFKMSKAVAFPFQHNNMTSLEVLLQKESTGQKYIAIESIYSMDGDEALLLPILTLAKKYDAHVIVDEAHSTGLYGTKGEGLLAEQKLQKDVFARIITYGKAIGGHGAAILGSYTLKRFLVNFARSFIFTTALPMHSLAHIYSAYKLLPYQVKKREKLKQLIALFKEKLNNNVLIHKNNSAIQSIMVPGNQQAKELSSFLETKGIYAKAILYPTIPKGSERLRICIHSFNNDEEIKLLTTFINAYTQQ